MGTKMVRSTMKRKLFSRRKKKRLPSVAWPDKPVKSVEIKLLAPSLNYQQRVYSNRNGLNSAELLTN